MERRPIQDFPGYWIYEDGRVWSDPKGSANPYGKFLKLAHNSDGYLICCLMKDRRKCMKRVNRLVIEAFVGPCPEDMECRHLDGNRTNNHVNNLCWGTKEENEADKKSHGTSNLGEKNPQAKLTEADVRTIRLLLENHTKKDIAHQFNVSHTQISRIASGKRWAHVK